MLARVSSSLARRATSGVLAQSQTKSTLVNAQAVWARGYRHWATVTPDDFALPDESMPDDVKGLMSTPDPRRLGYVESYWYWRIRAESTILDPESLPKKSYKQLARDMGLTVVNPKTEHIIGMVEYFEYLKSSGFVGPFGTVENPALVPTVMRERMVGCTGGSGDNEHYPLYFRCREGFLYRCGECDQIFMLVRLVYDSEAADAWQPPKDPDVSDSFDFTHMEQVAARWNRQNILMWPQGYNAWDSILGGGQLPVRAAFLEEEQKLFADMREEDERTNIRVRV